MGDSHNLMRRYAVRMMEFAIDFQVAHSLPFYVYISTPKTSSGVFYDACAGGNKHDRY